MPGRDYNKAYALFEQSLGDTAYPAYPTAIPPTYRTSLPPSTRSKSFAERSRLSSESDSSTHNSCVETHLLPPTPPPGAQNQDPTFGLSNRLTTPELTPDTRQGTPFTSLGAPTPNTTPPSLSGYPAAKHPRGLSYDSSRAESFRTAQEHASPTEIESPIDLPLQGAKRPESPQERHIQVYALGLKNFDRVTENAHRRLLHEMDLKRPSVEDLDTLRSVQSSEASTSVHKRRRVEKVPKELTFLEDAGHTSLKSPTNQESPSSWLDGTSSGENSPVVSNQDSVGLSDGGRLKTPESRILSSGSDGSPIVEASIVDSPPRSHRPLRHVSKNAELRKSPPQSKSARVLGTDDSTVGRAPQRTDGPTLQASSSLTNGESRADASSAERGHDLPVASRTRSLLAGRVPTSLRSKWRRSAPGSLTRDSPGGLTRGTMEAVPEDKPLIESPQPPSAFDYSESLVLSQRRSSEHSIAPTPSEKSLGRPGVDRFADRTSSRNTGARSSPVSDASEALVGDATAVNIYPHNNHSLLVVENPGSSSNTSKEADVMLSRTTTKEAEGSQNDPQTPVKDGRRNSRNVISPLTNPRRPPEPPSLSVIPPTPAKLDAIEAPYTSPEYIPLAVRQRSLSQRAKRYSDSLTSSVSRFAPGSRSKRSSMPASSEPFNPVERSTSQGNKDALHPTWKPRTYLNTIEANAPTPKRDSQVYTGRPDTDTLTAENMPPSSYASPDTKPERRLSLRRLLSARQEKDRQSEHAFDSSHSLNVDAMGAGYGSQRRGLTYSLRQRLQERNMRKEEQRHQERQEKLRHSIGTRFYVEHHGPNPS